MSSFQKHDADVVGCNNEIVRPFGRPDFQIGSVGFGSVMSPIKEVCFHLFITGRQQACGRRFNSEY